MNARFTVRYRAWFDGDPAVTPWAAGSTVAVAVLSTLAALRAVGGSPQRVAGGLVLMLLAFTLASLYLVEDPRLPYAAQHFFKWLMILSCLAGVGACGLAIARDVYWVVLPLLWFGFWALFVYGFWDGPRRLF